MARILQANGKPLPPTQRMKFLVDTGADRTMVDEQAMRLLGIPERGAIDIVGSTTRIDPVTLPTFDIQLEIRGAPDPTRTFPALEVLGKPFYNVSIEGLLGRDVLDQLQLTVGRGRYKLDY